MVKTNYAKEIKVLEAGMANIHATLAQIKGGQASKKTASQKAKKPKMAPLPEGFVPMPLLEVAQKLVANWGHQIVSQVEFEGDLLIKVFSPKTGVTKAYKVFRNAKGFARIKGI